MKTLNTKKIQKWVTNQGGASKALGLIISEGVSASTAERIVSGRYNNRPTRLLLKMLSKLTAISEEDLLISVDANKAS